MIVTLVGKSSKTLLKDFDAAGIEYETRPPQPGVIMNSGDAVKIAEVAISAATAVIVAWLKYAPTRKAMITTKDGTIWQAEGRSVAEVEQLLIGAKTIMVSDTKKLDLTSFGGFTIATSSDTEQDGIYGIAYCPICKQREESHDQGHGEQYAVNISLGKVRTHMRLVHKVKDEADA
jgi:hypothetical protein